MFRSRYTCRLNVILWIVLICCSFNALAQQQWGNLTAGKFKVGFTVLETYDYSRTYFLKPEYPGKPQKAPPNKPFQISIWYPAKNDAARPMLFREYARFWDKERDFSAPADNGKLMANMQRLHSLYFKGRLTDAKSDSILNIITAARYDANWAEGKFPVVISACPATKNHTVINEFLASQGYIVVSFPLLGRNFNAAETYWENAADLESFTEDIGFVLSKTKALANADTEKLAIIGTMAGASGIAFAVKNMNVDAIVSIDGSYREIQEALPKLPYFHSSRFRTPLLHFTNKNYNPLKEHEFLNNLKSANITQVQFTKLEHPDLYSQRAMNLTANKDQKTAYEQMCNMSLLFLDAHLNKNLQSGERLQRMLSGTDTLFLVTEKPIVLVTPVAEEFEQVILQKGIDAATELYRRGKLAYPDYAPFTENLVFLSSRLFKQGKKEEAIKITELVIEAFPGSAWAKRSLNYYRSN